MATHSSVLAWRIPGTGEPGGLPSMESHRIGHDWSDLAAAARNQYCCETMAYGSFKYILLIHSSLPETHTEWNDITSWKCFRVIQLEKGKCVCVGQHWPTQQDLFWVTGTRGFNKLFYFCMFLKFPWIKTFKFYFLGKESTLKIDFFLNHLLLLKNHQ